MFELATKGRGPLEMLLYSRLMGFIMSYGLIAVAVVIGFSLLQKFQFLINLKISDIFVVLCVLAVLDYFFGLGAISFLRGALINVLEKGM